MITLGGVRCCGVAEIDGLSSCDTPKDAMLGLAYNLRTHHHYYAPAYIMFTGVVELARNADDEVMGHARSNRVDNYGAKFADYLKEHNLGSVVHPTPTRSWSKNILGIWLWTPDWTMLINHLDNLEGK